jgi:hypothetical protein
MGSPLSLIAVPQHDGHGVHHQDGTEQDHDGGGRELLEIELP